MKNYYIAIAVLGTLLLSSCVQEKNFKDITVGENEIAFVMQGVSTRSAVEGTSYAVKGITIPMGEIEGESLYLEETIEELNPSPSTKGAPAYTTTLPDVYPTMGVYAAGNFGDATFEMMDEDMYLRKGSETDKGWRYHHNYNGNPWPAQGAVDFYLRMPEGEAPAAEGTATGPFVYTANTHSFKLTSPLNGKEQDDILFGHVQMTKKQHDDQLPNGYPVTMKHALTGIKFANGHPNDNETKTIITKVELIGLNKYGEGTINADGTVTWSSVTAQLSTTDEPFYLEFDNPTYVKDNGSSNPDGTVNTTGDKKWIDGLNNTSWTSAAANKNLNHANGELTFWFIPQEVPADLELKVYFTVKTPDSVDGFTTDACHTIDLGALLNEKYQEAGKTGNLKWEAGQLRTYTLKPYDVDVEIEDTIIEDTKSDLHIANTGNVDEYVRMLVIGNWYGWTSQASKDAGDEPSILVGYKYKGDEEGLTDEQKREMILPWYREGYPKKGNVYYATEAEATKNGWEKDNDGYGDPYGHFDNTFLLANLGSRDGAANDWADASGGFYFTMPIGPGELLETEQGAATKALFESYIVTDVPTIYIATEGVNRTPAVGVHLVMEIVVQAIAVPTITVGETTKDIWWLKAWYDATGIDKLAPDYVDKQGNTPNEKYVTIWKSGAYGSSVYVEE